MQVAVLAGGRATRLRPLTDRIPKSLVPVHGRPFLQYQIELLRAHGVTDIVLCVGHLARPIRDFCGDGSRFGVRISYSDEGERALGTAGALKWAEPLLGEAFFALFGDSYVRMDYRGAMERFLRRRALAMMAVYRNENRYDTSDVLVERGYVRAYNKREPQPGMVYINAGVCLVRRSALARLERGQRASLEEFLGPLTRVGLVLAYRTTRRFYEIGSPRGLRDFEHFVARGGHLP